MSDEKRGKFLQELRLEKKLTQKQLSEILHYSDNAVSNWEKGKTLPNNPETLMKLCELYDVSIEELLYGEKKNKNNSKNISDNMENIYKKNYKKIKKALSLSAILFLIIIIISLLSIYFIFIKGKILSYTIQGDSEHFIIDKSTILFTENIDILNFNKIISKNGEEINYIKLYYKIDDKEYLIFQGPNDNYYIEEPKGYNEYNLGSLKNNEIFIEISYNESSQETINLTLSQRYINDDIFIHKKEEIYDDSISKNKRTTNNDFIEFLLNEGFTLKDGEYEKQSEKVRIVFDSQSNIIYLFNQSKSIYEKLELDISRNNIFYEFLDENNDNYISEIYPLDGKELKICKIEFITENIEYLLYLKSKF